MIQPRNLEKSVNSGAETTWFGTFGANSEMIQPREYESGEVEGQ